jgi:hypothetical protein
MHVERLADLDVHADGNVRQRHTAARASRHRRRGHQHGVARHQPPTARYGLLHCELPQGGHRLFGRMQEAVVSVWLVSALAVLATVLESKLHVCACTDEHSMHIFCLCMSLAIHDAARRSGSTARRSWLRYCASTTRRCSPRRPPRCEHELHCIVD